MGLSMRFDEEAPPAVNKPEPHRAVHEPGVPRHPQVRIGDRKPENLIVAHAIVFRHDYLDGVAPQLQLPAQPEYDLSQPARLRHRRTFRRNHHHEHGCLTVPVASRAAASRPVPRPAGSRRTGPREWRVEDKRASWPRVSDPYA